MPVMFCEKSLAYILPFSSSVVSILAFIFTCALDVRKCFALASLFACGQLHGRAGCKQSLPTMQFALSQVRHRSIKKNEPQWFVLFLFGADDRT